MVAAPSASEASASVFPTASMSAPGSSAILSTPEAGAFAPATEYNCPAISTSPMPASMPSTTETEMARK